MKQYRIVKLYRPAIGTRWWLQLGRWVGTNGASGIASGRPKRRFVVEWEQDYPTREKADQDFVYWNKNLTSTT